MSPRRNYTGKWAGQYMLHPGRDYDLDKWRAFVEQCRRENKTAYDVIYEAIDRYLADKSGDKK